MRRIGHHPGHRSLALDELDGTGARQRLDAAIEEALEQRGHQSPAQHPDVRRLPLADDAHVDGLAHLVLAAFGHGQPGHERAGSQPGRPVAQLAPRVERLGLE